MAFTSEGRQELSTRGAGSAAELLREGGIYSRLHELQFVRPPEAAA